MSLYGRQAEGGWAATGLTRVFPGVFLADGSTFLINRTYCPGSSHDSNNPKADSPMTHVNRRRFLQLAGGTAATSLLSTSVARAAEIPAYRRTGTLRDVEHIVVLMQENRSF